MPKKEFKFNYTGKKYPNMEYSFSEMEKITGLKKNTIQRRIYTWGWSNDVMDKPLEKNKNKYKKIRKGYFHKQKNQYCIDRLYMQVNRLMQPPCTV